MGYGDYYANDPYFHGDDEGPYMSEYDHEKFKEKAGKETLRVISMLYSPNFDSKKFESELEDLLNVYDLEIPNEPLMVRRSA